MWDDSLAQYQVRDLMAQQNQRGSILDDLLNRAIGDPNAPVDLGKRNRPHERAIQGFLLFCGILSIFTTIGIVLVLGRESFAFFTRQMWEETLRTTEIAIDADTTNFRTTASGSALHEGEIIRISNEIMFIEEYDANQINVDSIGTGAGFDLFCGEASEGRPDIVDASRAMTTEDIQTCQSNSIEPLELRIGTDALAIAINPANDFATDLNDAEIRSIFSTAETWADVRPEFPNEPILRFIPGEDSGTFDYFVDAFFDGDPAPMQAESNLVTSEDDTQLTRAIGENEFAVGFFGFAFFSNNQNSLSVAAVNGVTPSAETVEDGTYPLSRPLYLYTSEEIIDTKEQVAAFLNYYLTHVNEEIDAVGYFPATDETLEATTATLLAAIGADELPEVDVESVDGNIEITGSSTVEPLTRRIAEIFREEGYLPQAIVIRGFQETLPAEHPAGAEIERGERVSLVEFFTTTIWEPQIRKFGIIPLVNATLMTSTIAMLVSLPIGIGAAVYLSEYAPENVRRTLKPILEILAGIPTVVYGYFALTFMTPFLRGIFGADVVNIYNTASAGIVVGVLIVPLISSMSEDALSAVPQALREASYGLGATKLETTFKVVLPAALSGIFAAFIVAVSRAIGETMIVAIAAGAGPNFTFNPFDSAETMTGHMARISGGDLSYDSIDYNSIYAIGLILFIITLVLNLISRAIINRFREAY